MEIKTDEIAKERVLAGTILERDTQILALVAEIEKLKQEKENESMGLDNGQ